MTLLSVEQVPPDAGTYNALVSGFERSRQPDKALEVYEEMKRLGIEVDKFVLSSLISVTADLRNRTKATGLLQVCRTFTIRNVIGRRADDP